MEAKVIIGISLILLAVVLSFLMLRGTPHQESNLTTISISCYACEVDNCECYIEGCKDGALDVYATSGCTGIPLFTIMFSSNDVTWYPQEYKTYYLKVLCEDGKSSVCIATDVSA